jgi:nucleoside permease NupC
MRSYLESLYTNSSSLGSKMEIGLNFACVVTAFTALVISGILTAQSTVPVTAQGSSSNDTASLLQSAKMHLIQGIKDG